MQDEYWPISGQPSEWQEQEPAITNIGYTFGQTFWSQLTPPEQAQPCPDKTTLVPTTPTKAKRVRTGCLTCRERHLKCDEGVPDCLNCRKRGRECKRGLRLNFLDVNIHKLVVGISHEPCIGKLIVDERREWWYLQMTSWLSRWIACDSIWISGWTKSVCSLRHRSRNHRVTSRHPDAVSKWGDTYRDKIYIIHQQVSATGPKSLQSNKWRFQHRDTLIVLLYSHASF